MLSTKRQIPNPELSSLVIGVVINYLYSTTNLM